eukprot:366553-Rhodomonas_salina.2
MLPLRRARLVLVCVLVQLVVWPCRAFATHVLGKIPHLPPRRSSAHHRVIAFPGGESSFPFARIQDEQQKSGHTWPQRPISHCLEGSWLSFPQLSSSLALPLRLTGLGFLLGSEEQSHLPKETRSVVGGVKSPRVSIASNSQARKVDGLSKNKRVAQLMSSGWGTDIYFLKMDRTGRVRSAAISLAN